MFLVEQSQMSTCTIPIPLTDVACQDLVANRNVAHHGNLRRRRLLNNLVEKVSVKTLKLDQVFRWQQSYIVLMEGCIYIYNNEMSSKPARATSLYGFTGVESCDHEVSSSVSWPFKLVSALENKEHNYYFSAPSKKDLQVWIKCLQDQLLKIFKIIERQGPTIPISPSSTNSEPSGGGGRPPLPPPRGALPGAEYIEMSEENDDDQLDYMEINEKEMDDAKTSVSSVKSSLQNQFANILNFKGGGGGGGGERGVEGASQFPVSGNQTQLVRHSLSTPSDISPSVQPKFTVFASKTKPFGPKVFAKGTSSSASVEKFSHNFQNPDDIMTTYVGAPSYLEFDKDAYVPKIESEAFWDGQPQEADLIMRRITQNGAYMLRESSEKGSQTLLVRLSSSVVKYKIQIDEKGRHSLLTTGPYFDTMALLIAYYKSNPVPRHNSPLTLPFSAVEKPK